MSKKDRQRISRETIEFLRDPGPKKVLLTRSAEEMRKRQELRKKTLDQLVAELRRKKKGAKK